MAHLIFRYVSSSVLLQPPSTGQIDDLAVLDRIQRRALWLAVSMVHHANQREVDETGVKVGGHQASIASMTSIVASLWFGHLNPGDRVSMKPHAGPLLHAVNYLLGRLEPEYLTRLRSYEGLQSYPSRTKDPDPVDFSTGSVGIGATATIWSAVADAYLRNHVEAAAAIPARRHIALLGDAELDEGAVWEALGDPMVSRLGNLMWVVDLNRQSLDRIVPDIAADRITAMFEALGWQVIHVKYGSLLSSLSDAQGGPAIRERIDTMSNEEYQALLRTPLEDLRERFVAGGQPGLGDQIVAVDDATLARAIADLGGHDLRSLMDAYRLAELEVDRPSVVLAYTVKGWSLPIQGHPSNHSALITHEQWAELAAELGADADDPWARFDPDSEEGMMCERTAAALDRPDTPSARPTPVVGSLDRQHRGLVSTQQAFGRVLVDLTKADPATAARIVTTSPDVASSTNLGGWINRVGVWNPRRRHDWFEHDTSMLVRWKEHDGGQHIELGIAEGNLVGLIGELGSTWSRDGEPLLPIGVLYDPFVTRALEPWSFGIYAGGQSILVGTPSGVSLSSEGGAHQSIMTPSVGVEQPGCVAWEPAFGQDLEWTLLFALGDLGHPGGSSAYFRLSTRPVDQGLAALPGEPAEREARRRDVLRGGYRLRSAPHAPDVTLVGVGAVMAEVVHAADELGSYGIDVDVLCLTSPDLVFRAHRARQGLAPGDDSILDVLFPDDRVAPIVTVLDGHPHTLAFLAAIHGVPLRSLGVDDFGQSGEVDDLYRHFGIDTATIVGAAIDSIDHRWVGDRTRDQGRDQR